MIGQEVIANPAGAPISTMPVITSVATPMLDHLEKFTLRALGRSGWILLRLIVAAEPPHR